jgi:hypothetical protein
MRWNKLILLTILALTASCVERFIPETTGYNKVLFIECLLSNDTAIRPVVHVSLTAPVVSQAGGKLTYVPEKVSGASVRIECDDNTVAYFPQFGAGNYRASTDFKAETGKSYKLIIQIDDKTYESDYQKLNQAPPMDSISCRHVLQKRSEDGLIIDGLRFYASTQSSEPGPSFYRWTLDATFRYQAPFLSTHLWDGRYIKPATNILLRDCWKSKNISGIYIGNTRGLSENRIQEAPLNFESQYGNELTIRYSLNVKQYNISESAMDFWENVTKLVNETGTLYETQPFRIEGNIKCTSDPSIYVAGIFEVAGVSTLRIFVNRPTSFTIFPLECFLQQVGTRDFPWYRLPAESFVTEQSPNVYMTANQACYDCQQRGGTLEKPPFWIEQIASE